MNQQRRSRKGAENEKDCSHGCLQFIWPLLLTFPQVKKKQGLFSFLCFDPYIAQTVVILELSYVPMKNEVPDIVR